MEHEKRREGVVYLGKFTSRKMKEPLGRSDGHLDDSLTAWVSSYLELAVVGVRSATVAEKAALHLGRFVAFFEETYGHDRISAVVRRDVREWQASLVERGLAPSTVNNYLASFSAFATWVAAQAPGLFAAGNPATGVKELGLPPLEPRALSEAQVRSLKNVCDRLERFHELKGRVWKGDEVPRRANGRPKRDRAMVFVMLSTGLRREELVNLDLPQVEPGTPAGLRAARRGRVRGVKGKGGTERTVFLSSDARLALAEYLEAERSKDADDGSEALFLSARGIPARRADGRLSVRAVNLVLEQIGRWHDAELADPARKVSPLRPHDLRHTFAFRLALETGADAYELERRLGHRSQRYIQRYTNPPEDVAAGYVEGF
ncbi:MAG: tyrosine-type recombinase/integrase [Actinomycetota bacterium]|nr:tyrosine-type recombinase/integrase [Actinomycetota bacterium]